jgi:hypothetical protein
MQWLPLATWLTPANLAANPGRGLAHPKYMRMIDFLANAFINTFGITQPDEKTRRRASAFILALMGVALLLVFLAAFGLYQLVHH